MWRKRKITVDNHCSNMLQYSYQRERICAAIGRKAQAIRNELICYGLRLKDD